jgi:hypothetical protein
MDGADRFMLLALLATGLAIAAGVVAALLGL